jgi:hypothetical protein
VDYYERVFAQRKQNSDYYYHLAASAWALLGNKGKALEYLNGAVEAGWMNAEFTRGQEEFRLLHSEPGWEAVLARME